MRRFAVPAGAVWVALALGMAPAREAELRVVFSGEATGYLAPCGCTKPMLGGIGRRGVALKRLARQGPVVALENGDWTLAEGRQDELKAEALADALSAMHYDAVGVGELDLQLGADFLRTLQGRMAAPMLCANVVAEGGAPFQTTAMVRRKIGGTVREVSIMALMASGHPLPDGFRMVDPVAALRRHKLKGHVRILLFHGRRSQAEVLARAVPGFALIVYAHGPDTPAPPVRIGRSALVCAGTTGKYLGVATIGADGTVKRVTALPLGEELGADAAIEGIRRGYLARVASENLLDTLPRSPLPPGEAYAGSDACRPCHESAHRVWRSSGHARAMVTLRRVGQDRDPECVPCHAVGVDREGGYLARKLPSLAAVGCESCHGPAQRHVTDPTKRPSRGGPASCAPCHVPHHSPGFRYDRYWKFIRH